MKEITFDELNKDEQAVLLKAKEAASHYYNPKGTHYVGAALQTQDGSIFQGAAVKRSAPSSTTCAERMAIDQAIFAGKREYKILSFIGFNIDGSPNDPVSSCGLCRQIIYEYYPEAAKGSILFSNSDMTKIIKTDIQELLPLAYYQ